MSQSFEATRPQGRLGSRGVALAVCAALPAEACEASSPAKSFLDGVLTCTVSATGM